MWRPLPVAALLALVSTGCSLSSRAIGKWSVVDAGPGGLRWVAIRRGESRSQLQLVWPTGLGCQTEAATVGDHRIDVRFLLGGTAHIALTGRSTATLTFDDPHSTWHLEKTTESAYFLCQ